MNGGKYEEIGVFINHWTYDASRDGGTGKGFIVL